jgi:hypothetical protein
MQVAKRHAGVFPLKIKGSGELAAATVKQNDGAARLEPSHFDVVGDRRREGQDLSGRERFWAIKAGVSHAGCSVVS